MKHSPSSAPRRGTTRLEVISIVLAAGLLIAVLIPALEAARETARRESCRRNLRQLGQALHAYHDVQNVLPPAAIWGAEGLDLPQLLSHKDPTPVQVTRENWIQLILPELGAEPAAAAFDRSVPMVDAKNAKARTLEQPEFKCPSDPYNHAKNQYRLKLADGSECLFARGNYAINGGGEYVPASFGSLSNPAPTENRYNYSEETRQFQWWGSGVAGINRCLKFSDFQNGQASLVAVDEIRDGLAPIDPRGVWAFGQIGGSITWGHGILGDAGGPNYNDIDGGADDILGGNALYKALGRKLIEGESMQCCDHCNENFQATARSKHPGGVQALMLDGAVRFISNEIDATLWHVLHSSETPADRFPANWEQELHGPRWTEAKPPQHRELLDAADEEMERHLTNGIGMKFVRVDAGEFIMGMANKDNKYPFPHDAVPHRVRITRPFYLGMHEVTQSQFEAVTGKNPSRHRTEGDTSQYPVENVSWDDALQFCSLLSAKDSEKQAGRRFRLPTEAEWEYACRAGVRGEIFLDTEWGTDDGLGHIASKLPPKKPLVTQPVGSYPANAFGLHDMCGNVYEWVNDFRVRGYYKRSPVDDPQGPSTGTLHVIRGWYWVATGPKCKVYVANDPWSGSKFIGFRVVCERVNPVAEPER